MRNQRFATILAHVVMDDVYHELNNPQTVLGHSWAALKPDDHLVLVKLKAEDPTIPIFPSHEMTVAQAKTAVEAHGSALTTAGSSLPRRHVLIFTKVE